MYTLSNSNIDRLSCEIMSLLESARVPPQGRTRIRLTVEELLLQYQERFGSETELELMHTKRFGKLTLKLRIRCDSFDPIADIPDGDFWLQNVLQSLGYAPVWRYKNGCNEISFPVKCESRLPDWAVTLIACGLGILFGFAAHLLPQEALSTLTVSVLDPVSAAVMRFLSAVSAILIFLSIINGIIGMGSLDTLNRIGKTMLGRIMLSMLALGAVIVAIFALIFPISGGAGGGFDFGSLWNMILDIIPGSFFDPFNSGNALQILFLSFIIGLIMLASASRLQPVINVVQGLYQIVQDMMVLVLKALPLVVFISIFDLFSGSADIDLRAVYKYPLLQLIISFGWLAVIALAVCVKQKVKPAVLTKKLLPTFLIGLSTASSNAALSTSMETCEKKLGISPKLVRVGVPLSHSIDKPPAMILLMTGTVCMAQMFSVDISWSALVTMTLTVLLLAIAAPAVPGSGVSIFTLLFTLYGIPLEALSIVISLDVITDRICTSFTVSNTQLDLIQEADSLGELDKDVLRR